MSLSNDISIYRQLVSQLPNKEDIESRPLYQDEQLQEVSHSYKEIIFIICYYS